MGGNSVLLKKKKSGYKIRSHKTVIWFSRKGDYFLAIGLKKLTIIV